MLFNKTRQYNVFILNYFLSIGQDKSKLQISVALICLVLYLKKIILYKMCILYCLVVLNSGFLNLVCFYLV